MQVLSRCVELTPPQSIRIHGWRCPTRMLLWSDIVSNQHVTLQILLEMGISNTDLRHLQPSVAEWIESKQVGHNDVKSMLSWPLHPIDDLDGDLSDLVMGNYESSMLETLQITYDTLRSLQMGHEHMILFHYTMEQWHQLGLSHVLAAEIPLEISIKTFGIQTDELCQKLKIIEN
jgi:hypothetical protein